MKTSASKFEFFLELALMDRQWPLVVYESEEQKQEVQRAFETKQGALEPSQNLLFLLTPSNLSAAMKSITAERRNGMRIFGSSLAVDSKTLFLMNKKTFSALPEAQQENLLTTFSPIFRFDL